MVGVHHPFDLACVKVPLQEYLAHEKHPPFQDPLRNLDISLRKGPRGVLEGWVFFLGEVPLSWHFHKGKIERVMNPNHGSNIAVY